MCVSGGGDGGYGGVAVPGREWERVGERDEGVSVSVRSGSLTECEEVRKKKKKKKKKGENGREG